MRKLLSVLIAMCILVCCIPFGGFAAYDVVPSSGSGAVYYTGSQAILYVNNATWADAHYNVNGGTDINVRMDVDSNGQNTYVINNLAEGDVVNYWFTIYTTYATDQHGYDPYTHTAPSSQGGDEPVVTDKNAYVFKVGSMTGYSVLYGEFPIEAACQFCYGSTYVPFRTIASVAGAKSVTYDPSASTITIVNNSDVTFGLAMNSTAITVAYPGMESFASQINSAPVFIDGKACLPIRDTANITGANIVYRDSGPDGYVIVCNEELTESEIADYISASQGQQGGGDEGGGDQPSGETSRYNNSNTTDTTIPVLRTDIPQRENMFVQINNNTGGQYSDDQVYWCIIGKDPSTGAFCYVNSAGQLVPCTLALNTISKNGRMCADICYTVAECSYVYMPNITSGRMYFSYGDQVYITINTDGDGNIGYAGPDLNNTSDPNQDVLFEFIEFTVTDGVYWGNTTRVDFYSFPIVTRLVGTGGFVNSPGDADVYDMTVGDIGTRAQTFAAFNAEVPANFRTLITDKRIMAPCKSTFNEGQPYGSFFESYINQFWSMYQNNPFTFNCDAGSFTCYTSGDYLYFTSSGGQSGRVSKPNTQEVLEGKGNLASGTSIELVVEAQLCAAFNRGVATDPANWGNANAYYQNGTSNLYSGFWHDHSVDRYAYGFCYDDVFDHSTLLHYSKPKALIVDLRW
ncbi:MAG: hypothetical protein IJL87_04955 [Clostridia bacterium]|nr:hypothetical protein [Clostridia bacterium]